MRFPAMLNIQPRRKSLVFKTCVEIELRFGAEVFRSRRCGASSWEGIGLGHECIVMLRLQGSLLAMGLSPILPIRKSSPTILPLYNANITQWFPSSFSIITLEAGLQGTISPMEIESQQFET